MLADSETLLGFRMAGIRNALVASADVDASISQALDTPGTGILVVTQDLVDRSTSKMRSIIVSACTGRSTTALPSGQTHRHRSDPEPFSRRHR